MLGQPLEHGEKARLEHALDSTGGSRRIRGNSEASWTAHCLIGIEINAESRVKSMQGPARPRLIQNGWSVFLVKVHNEAGVTAELAAESPNAAPMLQAVDRPSRAEGVDPAADVVQRWADVAMFNDRPLQASSLGIEPRVSNRSDLQPRRRQARGAGSASMSARARRIWASGARSTFSSPAIRRLTSCSTFATRMADPIMASFIFRDKDGTGLSLAEPPARTGLFLSSPGLPPHRESRSPFRQEPMKSNTPADPSTETQTRTITVPNVHNHREMFRLRRWIQLSKMNWFSGDHHVHAAGCAHYESPTEGVKPQDMWRHILGEDLDVGCVLSWGPCWYAQKQFFDGKIHPLSTPEYLMRYDVEVSGFPSSHAGHLCLLAAQGG